MVSIGMKRDREEDQNSLAPTANYLMLLSHDALDSFGSLISRTFQCKTCKQQFSSFQALGGHRASHKKSNLTGGNMNALSYQHQLQSSPSKPKTHECSICGKEFSIGQALGGHMRRHRASASAMKETLNELPLSLASSTSRGSVVKKTSNKRVLCFDLNLIPLENGTPAGPLLNFYL